MVDQYVETRSQSPVVPMLREHFVALRRSVAFLTVLAVAMIVAFQPTSESRTNRRGVHAFRKIIEFTERRRALVQAMADDSTTNLAKIYWRRPHLTLWEALARHVHGFEEELDIHALLRVTGSPLASVGPQRLMTNPLRDCIFRVCDAWPLLRASPLGNHPTWQDVLNWAGERVSVDSAFWLNSDASQDGAVRALLGCRDRRFRMPPTMSESHIVQCYVPSDLLAIAADAAFVGGEMFVNAEDGGIGRRVYDGRIIVLRVRLDRSTPDTVAVFPIRWIPLQIALEEGAYAGNPLLAPLGRGRFYRNLTLRDTLRAMGGVRGLRATMDEWHDRLFGGEALARAARALPDSIRRWSLNGSADEMEAIIRAYSRQVSVGGQQLPTDLLRYLPWVLILALAAVNLQFGHLLSESERIAAESESLRWFPWLLVAPTKRRLSSARVAVASLSALFLYAIFLPYMRVFYSGWSDRAEALIVCGFAIGVVGWWASLVGFVQRLVLMDSSADPRPTYAGWIRSTGVTLLEMLDLRRLWKLR